MSMSNDHNHIECYPPLATCTQIFNEDTVHAVIIDEDIQTVCLQQRQQQDHLYFQDHFHHHGEEESTVERTRGNLEIDSVGRKSWKTLWRYAALGTLFSVLGISFLVMLAGKRVNLVGSSITRSKVEQPCSKSNLQWQAIIQIRGIGSLNPISMNNQTIVGMRGQTIMETVNLLTKQVQVQYMDTPIQSLTLTHSGVLVCAQSNHIGMLSNKDEGGGVWRASQDFQLEASVVASNGKSLAVWFGGNVHVLDAQSKQLANSLEDVTYMAMTLDGTYLYIATDNLVKCVRKEDNEWIVQETLWRKSNNNGDDNGRRIQLDVNQTHTELDVSADGSLLAILASTRQVLFYTAVGNLWKELGGGGTMDATHITVSSTGRRAAVATSHGSVLILERRDNAMIVVYEIETLNVTLMNFQENRLQIIDGDVMTMYEHKCDVVVGD